MHTSSINIQREVALPRPLFGVWKTFSRLPVIKHLRFHRLQMKRQIFVADVRDMQVHNVWALGAAEREQNPLWRREFDGEPKTYTFFGGTHFETSTPSPF